ncbi:MAG: DNA polymerase IV [Thermoleophilia bacterium]|nr:DNA polymerase IV [Thermoleophilia bacterium]
MTPGPSILHADLDAFYASVEQRDDPKLRDRPVIVGGGVVLACSYEAKARGVRTAMNGGQAKRLCPEAIVVPPRMSAYTEASRAVYKLFEETSPVVEALSIDEAFLDARGLEHISGTPPEIAANLRREVLDQVSLKISVGVARTKFLAKVASGACKPDGLLVVEKEGEAAFLHPLPIERLWGVGKVTSEKLHSMGISTVGEIAACREESLVAALGPASGRRLLDLANNRDPRDVRKRERRRSIGAQSAFPSGSRNAEEVDSLAASLVDRTTRRLRKADRTCRTVVVGLRFADFSRASRSHTFPGPTSQTETILAAVRVLLSATRPMIEAKGLTLLSISLANLDQTDTVQMELPFEGEDSSALDAALDDLRERFGADAVTRASLIDRDAGVSVPLLPD